MAAAQDENHTGKKPEAGPSMHASSQGIVMTNLARRVFRWVGRLAILYAIVVLLAWGFQRKMIYVPAPGPVDVPYGMTYQRIQDIAIPTADGETLRAWFWPGEREATIVVFHGNAGHRGHRLPWITRLRDLGYTVLIFDYRGYGGSTGSPSEEGLYADGEAVLSWLKEHGIGEVIYLGQSLGSGVAVEMASRHAPRGLIVQGAFTSLVDVSATHYPFLPAHWLLSDRYENVDKIGSLDCPILILHAEHDEVVPPELGEELARHARNAHFVTIEGATHNTMAEVGGTHYEDVVRAFLDEVTREPR
ncbi:MAG: alpha/beta hydrolase [Planctomycetes bacterium]|nr:alpha/beta hydrolase [Planctomycetota bacterium]